MTDEELENSIREVTRGLDEMAGLERPLNKDEARKRQMLLMERNTLRRIKEAREKNDINTEHANLANYGLLKSWGAKHPFLAFLLQAKFRWRVL